MTRRCRKRRHTAAFSLVEVTIALGIAGFCLLAILGMLQVGLNSERATIDQTVGTDILTRVFQDLTDTPPTGAKSAEFKFNLVSTNVQTVWFADSSTPLSSSAGARYRASVLVSPPPAGSLAPSEARIQVAWPAAADPGGGAWPTKNAGFVETTTAFDRH